MSQLVRTSLVLFCSLVAFQYSLADSETLKGAKKDFTVFKEEMSEKLSKVETKLTELKDKGHKNSSEASKKAITELEETRDKLKKEIVELKDDSKESWKSFRKSLATSLDSLNTKIQSALKNHDDKNKSP